MLTGKILRTVETLGLTLIRFYIEYSVLKRIVAMRLGYGKKIPTTLFHDFNGKRDLVSSL